MKSISGMIALAVAAAVTAGGTAMAAGEAKPVLPLWPEGAPGAMGEAEADKPSMTVYLPDPDKATGAGVVIFPGGGYGHLAMDHEGHQVAQWLNGHGIAGFIVKYRISPYRHPAPLNDAQRAVRMVRARAVNWNLDPRRVGVLGFSAGGHLTSTIATHFDLGDENASDPVERYSCRPDFAVLVYPVISFTTEYAHRGSMRNLLGDDPDPELVKSLSNELQVTADTPPTFLMHTTGDAGVPPENSVLFYLALRKAGVPAEMHIYEKGRHGLGLAQDVPALSSWPARCIDWFKTRGVIE